MPEDGQPYQTSGAPAGERKASPTPPPEAQAFQGSQPQYLPVQPESERGHGTMDASDTGNGNTVTYQSQAWWNESRVKVNPARRGENEH